MLIKKAIIAAVSACMLFLLIAGCSSNEENPIAPPTTSKPPTFTLKKISFPQHMLSSTDAHAQQAVALVNEALDFDPCGCVFAPPSGAETVKETNGEWEYSWTSGDLTQTLQITAVSGRNSWKIFYDGAQGGTTFSNWRFMDAVQSTDLSSGHVTLFKAGTVETEMEWVWYTLEQNEYKIIRQFYGDPPYKIDLSIKPDNSGKIDRFAPNSSGSMVYDVKYSWSADGTGSYWTFEDGKQTGFGTWQ